MPPPSKLAQSSSQSSQRSSQSLAKAPPHAVANQGAIVQQAATALAKAGSPEALAEQDLSQEDLDAHNELAQTLQTGNQDLHNIAAPAAIEQGLEPSAEAGNEDLNNTAAAPAAVAEDLEHSEVADNEALNNNAASAAAHEDLNPEKGDPWPAAAAAVAAQYDIVPPGPPPGPPSGNEEQPQPPLMMSTEAAGSEDHDANLRKLQQASIHLQEQQEALLREQQRETEPYF